MKYFQYILLILCVFFSHKHFCHAQEVEYSSLVLVEESLPQVLAILEHLEGKTILYDQNLPGIKINLNIPDKRPVSEIIQAIENVLSINGVSIIDRHDGFLRAVNSRSVINQAPELIEGSSLSLPISDKIYAKVFFLQNIAAAEFSKLIRPILSFGVATVLSFEESNSLLIVDKLSNLQRIETLINMVDKPKSSRIESKIFRIKHGDAKNIANVLTKLISERNNDGDYRNSLQQPESASVIMPSNISMVQSQVHEATSDDFKISSNVSIECDEYSNSVIVCGNEQDINQIGRIIDGIDVLLDQVRIEVVIAQVTLSNNQTSGLETLGISYNTITDVNGNVALSGNNQVGFHGSGASNNRVDNGFHVNGTLNNFSLSYVFNKAKSCDDVIVLSAPTIVTTHNREASVKVGESRPVITANFSDLQNQRSIRNNVSYKDIGIELVVTPLIGQNGIIQMKIDQLIQKINGEITVDGNKQPIISKRQAMSFVSVHDGDVVVLAGLQEKESINSRSKLWLLGSMPIIGNALFSPKIKSEQTNELIIFIRPTIIKNPSSEDEYYQKFISGEEVKNDLKSYEDNKKFLKKLPKKHQQKSYQKSNRFIHRAI